MIVLVNDIKYHMTLNTIFSVVMCNKLDLIPYKYKFEK